MKPNSRRLNHLQRHGKITESLEMKNREYPKCKPFVQRVTMVIFWGEKVAMLEIKVMKSPCKVSSIQFVTAKTWIF